MECKSNDIRPFLIAKLKQEHRLWSYENDSIQDIPDDVLVELVMLYLDIEEINMLFQLFSYKKVKRAWIENVVAQGERYYNLNYFLAWYYFHVKQPRKYVKSMATRQLNKRLAAWMMLTNGDLFRKDEQFIQLQPVYNVTARDIETYIKGLLQ